MAGLSNDYLLGLVREESRFVVEPPSCRGASPVPQVDPSALFHPEPDMEGLVVRTLKDSSLLLEQLAHERLHSRQEQKGTLAVRLFDNARSLTRLLSDKRLSPEFREFVFLELGEAAGALSEFLVDPGIPQEEQIKMSKELIKMSMELNRFIKDPEAPYRRETVDNLLKVAIYLSQFNDVFLDQLKEQHSASPEADDSDRIPPAFLRHELRTPLQTVIGNLMAAKESFEEGIFADLIDGYKHLSSLSELLFAEGMALEPTPETFHLKRLVEYVHNQTKRYDRGRVQIQFDAPDVIVHADFQKLSMALINLISNAIKFSPSDRPVMVGIRQDGPHFIFAIRDFGDGMSDEVIRDRLFKLFSPSDKQHKSIKSSGIGLFISQKLVRAMGGLIRVESIEAPNPDHGSAFSFRIPMPIGRAEEIGRSPTPTRTPTPRTPDHSPLLAQARIEVSKIRNRDVRIIAADDDGTTRRMVTAVLKKIGVKEVNYLPSGDEAVSQFDPSKYNLVILDNRMPGRSGWQTAQEIHKIALDAGIARLPIIMISGDADPEIDVELAKQMNFTLLIKPVVASKFVETIDQLL